jgi:PAS domain S-box-containing protein
MGSPKTFQNKKIDRRSAAAEDFLRLVVDTIPALVVSALPDGSVDFINKGWRDYTGLPLENLTGWGWNSAIHPEDLARFAQEWEVARAAGKPFQNQARIRKSDGVYRWFLIRKTPLRDQSGRIVKWYGAGYDIEDLKRTEQELRRSDFYLGEGERLAHTGSWAFNPSGFFYHWSRELLAIYGLDPAGSAPTLEEYLQLIHPDDREFMAQLIERMVAEHAGCDVKKRIIRPGGELRYIRCVGTPIVVNGALTEIVGSAIDVTEQEHLTQELERWQAYLTEAQRLSHTGSFGWKPDSGEIVWSDETYRIFEYDRAVKLTIDAVVQRLHPEDRADFQKVIERASAGATHFEHAYRLLLPDGRVKHIHALAHAMQDACSNREFVGAATDVSEQKWAQEALRQSENYLAEAQRLTHMGSWAWQVADREAMHLSEEWYRIYGFDPKQGAPSWEERLQRIHLEDRDRWQETLERAIREKSDYDLEFRILLPDGTLKWVYTVGHPVLSAAGELVQFVGSSMDVTDRKLAERTLRESEAYLAEAQRLSKTGSWAATPGQDIRYWSEECYRVLGFDQEDGLPRLEEFFQRIHPDDRPGFRELIQTSTRERAEFVADYRIVHPGGTVRDIHVVGHPVLSTSGHLVEFVGTVIDITEHKRAEAEIREQETEIRQILDLTPQLVAVFGPSRERLYANRTALDYFGVSLEEWQEISDPFRFFHQDDREPVIGGRDSAFETGAPHQFEARLRRGDGSYRWFLARYNPFRDERGQVTRWYVACTDIDDRKRTEERLRNENVALREEIDRSSMFEEIVGASPALQAVLSRVAKVAPTDSTVLITGETGTGKELIARAVHKRSARSERPFVSVNCAAIPQGLLASELFGHEKGAFTGALQRRLGRFELAEGGTIFLDEIGELPSETQIALLRVLQEREFERVGGHESIRADVRVIAATNRDLEAAIDAGVFRSDLFYRLNVFPIAVPPLRERKEDIRMLVEYFLDRYASKAGKKIRSINRKTLDQLTAYLWPGNIRELQNVVERSVILCETENFSVDDSWLPHEAIAAPQVARPLTQRLVRQEKEIIEAALAESKGRISGTSGAAAKLGIPPSTLESKIRSLKINKRQFVA